jgi:thioredoxin-related protein
MKSLAIIATGIIMMMLVASQNPAGDKPADVSPGISFYKGSISEAMELAKKEDKPVFIDISASWCYYCKRMKANVYTNSDVADFYNKSFINISVDGEKGEGKELVKKYGVNQYPTFVFLNSDGSLSLKTSGYHNSEKFISLGKNEI